MHLSTNMLDDAERRFLQGLLTPSAASPNREAEAIIGAIQQCFDGISPGSLATVDAGLPFHLATCARIALHHPAGAWIPWDGADYDHVILLLLRSFMRTLASMLRNNEVTIVGNGVMCGKFVIPHWFVEDTQKRYAALA